MRGTIKSGSQIDLIFNKGTHFNSRDISLISYADDEAQRDPSGRVAVIAGKRIGNAVVRNRSKRVIRAAAQEVGLPCKGHDVVLIATRRTGSAPHSQLVGSLRMLMRRAGLVS